jgi:hypothetical protein
MDDYLRSILIIPVHSNVLILNESKSSLDEGAQRKDCPTDVHVAYIFEVANAVHKRHEVKTRPLLERNESR